jgi:hypothetical protein
MENAPSDAQGPSRLHQSQRSTQAGTLPVQGRIFFISNTFLNYF